MIYYIQVPSMTFSEGMLGILLISFGGFMPKKAIVFVDANNWYHNVKKVFNPGDIDIKNRNLNF